MYMNKNQPTCAALHRCVSRSGIFLSLVVSLNYLALRSFSFIGCGIDAKSINIQAFGFNQSMDHIQILQLFITLSIYFKLHTVEHFALPLLKPVTYLYCSFQAPLKQQSLLIQTQIYIEVYQHTREERLYLEQRFKILMKKSCLPARNNRQMTKQFSHFLMRSQDSFVELQTVEQMNLNSSCFRANIELTSPPPP